MNKAKILLKKILYLPIWIVAVISTISFAGLLYIFADNKTESATAYVFYVLSAYSLVVLIIAVITRLPCLKSKIDDEIAQKPKVASFLNAYKTDDKFKSNIGLFQGTIIDGLYALFRLITGIFYRSVWFITLAVYHLFLCLLRAYLFRCERKEKHIPDDMLFEFSCYEKTARLIILLNIPMSGMVFLMIWANSGFAYPEYVIYLSAMYTFYKAITAVVKLVKCRKIGSPILAAEKTINLIAAMMSVLGLQTAMIAAFSENQEAFRFTANAIVGTTITLSVLAIAVFMIIRAKRKIKEIKSGTDMYYE